LSDAWSAKLAQQQRGVRRGEERATPSARDGGEDRVGDERQPHRLLIAGEAVDHPGCEPLDALG